jgi:acyl-CoA synthetase (AMP-forming)/AMP-acid ligase II
VPAAAAAAAYANGRFGISYDFSLIGSLAKSTIRTKYRELRDRVSMFYVLENHALNSAQADKIFMIYEGREYSYKQTYDTVLKYGQWLKTKHNVQPRDIVALDFMNGDHYIFLWWGLWSIGAQPACLNYNLTGNALIHCVRTATSALLLVENEIAPAITDEVRSTITAPGFLKSGGSTKIQIFTPDVVAEILASPSIREPDSAREGRILSDMAMLIYTSGTTGLPKPAVVSWQKVQLVTGFVNSWLGMRVDDRLYTVSFSHLYPLTLSHLFP